MIKAAGIGVAMGNARDNVKSYADYITTDNESDGFKKAMEELVY